MSMMNNEVNHEIRLVVRGFELKKNMPINIIFTYKLQGDHSSRV